MCIPFENRAFSSLFHFDKFFCILYVFTLYLALPKRETILNVLSSLFYIASVSFFFFFLYARVDKKQRTFPVADVSRYVTDIETFIFCRIVAARWSGFRREGAEQCSWLNIARRELWERKSARELNEDERALTGLVFPLNRGDAPDPTLCGKIYHSCQKQCKIYAYNSVPKQEFKSFALKGKQLCRRLQ